MIPQTLSLNSRDGGFFVASGPSTHRDRDDELALICSPSKDWLLSAFGAVRFARSAGVSREETPRAFDVQIAEAALELFRTRPKGEVRLLEIGAGRTYRQLSTSIGTIAFARRLASVAERYDARVICADHVGRDEKCIFFIDHNQELSSVGVPVTLPGVPESKVEKASTGEIRIRPLEEGDAQVVLDKIKAATLPIEAQVPENPTGHIFCRPALDTTAERLGSGIDCVLGCDYRTLEQFKGRTFDMIWGRHLFPSEDPQEIQMLKEAVGATLKEGGLALIHVDGGSLLIGRRTGELTLWSE